MPPVIIIPDHVLVIIFSYIESLRETNNVRLVCRRWNDLILSYWSKIEKLTLDKYIESPESFVEYASAIAKRHPNVKEVTIEPIDRSTTPNVVEKVPCHYAAIGQLFTKLEKLIVYDTLIEDKALVKIIAACPKLSAICLYSCYEVRTAGVTKALRSAPQLKELELIGCPEVSSDIAVHCRNLAHLTFEECPFDNTAWAQLSDSGGKDSLEKLATTPLDYDRLCLISQRFPKLKHLYIAEFDDQDHFTPSNFMGFPLLETLCLTYGSVSNDENLIQIISKCPSLRVLWVWNCVNKAIASFIDTLLGQLEDTLIHLIVDDLKTAQIESMNLRHFTKLRKLTIIGTTLTNSIIQRLIEGCPSLTHLDIADSTPPSSLEIKPIHNDLWLNMRPNVKRAACINIEPPFRANYKNNEDNYEGPILETNRHTKRPEYYYRRKTN